MRSGAYICISGRVGRCPAHVRIVQSPCHVTLQMSRREIAPPLLVPITNEKPSFPRKGRLVRVCHAMAGSKKRRVTTSRSKGTKLHKQGVRKKFLARHIDQVREVGRRRGHGAVSCIYTNLGAFLCCAAGVGGCAAARGCALDDAWAARHHRQVRLTVVGMMAFESMCFCLHVAWCHWR